MSNPDFRPRRFTSWDGTQDPLGPDVEELFSRLSEDVFHGWDFESALRRLLSQGWRDRGGKRLLGLEAAREGRSLTRGTASFSPLRMARRSALLERFS